MASVSGNLITRISSAMFWWKTVSKVGFFLRVFLAKIAFFFLFLFLGPFGERDDQQVFIQKLVPDTDHVIVRFSSTGKR